MSELLSCPFCRGPAEMCDRDLNNRPFWVVCRACDVAGPRGASRPDAAAAWNRRAAPKEEGAQGQPVAWQVRHHGENGYVSQWNFCHNDADRPTQSGRFRCEYRPLYASPSIPAGTAEGLEKIAHRIALRLYPAVTPDMTGWLLVEHAERVVLHELQALKGLERDALIANHVRQYDYTAFARAEAAIDAKLAEKGRDGK